jgi:hypothetical protein
VRVLRSLVALGAASLLAWASVADSRAVCPDEQGELGHGHEAPGGAHCCLTAPCGTPTVTAAVAVVVAPTAQVAEVASPPPAVIASLDLPAPPTPPPTALD